MSEELSDKDLEQLLEQAEDDVRADPELSEQVRQHLSSELDGIVEQIKAILAADPTRPGDPT